MSDPKLDTLSQEMRQHYLERRGLLILEGAIGCMLDAWSPAEVARILRQNAEHLEDHG